MAQAPHWRGDIAGAAGTMPVSALRSVDPLEQNCCQEERADHERQPGIPSRWPASGARAGLQSADESPRGFVPGPTWRAPASGNTSLSMRPRDGRSIGILEVGRATGVPVFHSHGSGGSSRLEALLVARAAVRLIALDRPGIGRCDPCHHDRLLDWPEKVVEVAGALKKRKFAVLGMSAGGPYALACAARIPHRLTACGPPLLPPSLLHVPAPPGCASRGVLPGGSRRPSRRFCVWPCRSNGVGRIRRKKSATIPVPQTRRCAVR